MMDRRWKPVVFALLLALPALPAQNLPDAKTPLVSLAPVSPVSVAAGSSARIEFTFRVNPGLHINSARPNSDLQIPTALKLSPPAGVAVAKLTYPPGQDLTLAFAPDIKLSVYSGQFAVKGTVSAQRTAAPGPVTVRGELYYQACDDRECYPPRSLPIEFQVQVVKAAKRR